MHREARGQLKQSQAERNDAETKTRSRRLPTGLKALWFRVTGKYRQIKKRNEAEALRCKLRDQSEVQKLVERQLNERRSLQHEIRLLRHHHGIRIKKLGRDINVFLKLSPAEQNIALSRSSSRDTKRKRSRFFSP